jgi:hypothetical protein
MMNDARNGAHQLSSSLRCLSVYHAVDYLWSCQASSTPGMSGAGLRPWSLTDKHIMEDGECAMSFVAVVVRRGTAWQSLDASTK